MFTVYGITDVGCLRENNEDHIYVCGKILNTGEFEHVIGDDFSIVAVSDGMGGMEAGEIASKITTEMLTQIYSDSDLSTALIKINKTVFDYASNNLSSKGMGCTLTGLVLINDKIKIFHIGDSRAYRFRNGFLMQLTNDHSLVQALFDAGDITRSEMESHDMKNVLLQAVGTNMNIKPDIFEYEGSIDDGDLLMLCTDGLFGLVSVDDMESILCKNISNKDKAKMLVERAKQNGGYDNISVIVLRKDKSLGGEEIR